MSRLFVEVTQRLRPQTLTPEHQAGVKRLVARFHEETGYPFNAIYADLNDHFHAGKYSDIPDDAWEEVNQWFQQRLEMIRKRKMHDR